MYRPANTMNAHPVPGLAGTEVPQNYTCPGRVRTRRAISPASSEMLHLLSAIERMGL